MSNQQTEEYNEKLMEQLDEIQEDTTTLEEKIEAIEKLTN